MIQPIEYPSRNKNAVQPLPNPSVSDTVVQGQGELGSGRDSFQPYFFHGPKPPGAIEETKAALGRMPLCPTSRNLKG
jgi:hypothetical protein